MAATSFSGSAKPARRTVGDFDVNITLYKADGVTPRANKTVTLTNEISGETISGTTDANGQVTLWLADLASGFSVGDRISVEQTVSDDDIEYFVTGNGGATNPTWVAVDNNVRTAIPLNTARFKLNSVRRSGGIDINLSKSS